MINSRLIAAIPSVVKPINETVKIASITKRSSSSGLMQHSLLADKDFKSAKEKDYEPEDDIRAELEEWEVVTQAP